MSTSLTFDISSLIQRMCEKLEDKADKTDKEQVRMGKLGKILDYIRGQSALFSTDLSLKTCNLHDLPLQEKMNGFFKLCFPKWANRDVHVSLYNPSIVDNGATYIICARYIVSLDGEPTPGNDISCPRPLTVGKNFWWNNWSNPKWRQYGTLFFRWNPHGNFMQYMPIKIESEEPFYMGSTVQDGRLCRVGNEILFHNSNMSSVFKVTTEYNEFCDYVWSLRFKSTNMGIDEEGKNQSLICYDIFTRIYTVANIFGNEGIELVKYREKTKLEDVLIPYGTNKLSYKGSHLTDNDKDKEHFGVNYGIMPLLSFTTPHVRIGNTSYLAVGHIKIHTDEIDYPYLEGSNIDVFRKRAYKEMKEAFGDMFIQHKGSVDYICRKCRCYSSGPAECQCSKCSLFETCEHEYVPRWYKSTFSVCDKDESCKNGTNEPIEYPEKMSEKDLRSLGYIYMMFFYIIDPVNKTMKMSDAFLPIPMNPFSKKDTPINNYKFLLAFPTGITITEGSLVRVTYGDGDLYSRMYEQDLETIQYETKHDVTNMDFNNFEYNLLWVV